MKKYTSLLVLTLTIVQIVCAQNPGKQLDSLFTDLSNHNFINGTVLAAQNGNISYQQSYGWGNISKDIKNTATTTFELASLSKIFTAVAIMQLEEKKLLSLDDAVIKFLPDFPYPQITVKQLLSHTSGLPDFELFDSYFNADPARIMTNRDIIPALKQWGKLKLSPGQQWSYSSPGMGLLALIVEKISRTTFQNYLATHIYKPAGMSQTYTLSALNKKDDDNRAVPYAYNYYFSTDFSLADTIKQNQRFLHQSGGVEGPGLLVSSTGDLLKFDQALFNNKLLKPATLGKMFTPAKLANGTPVIAPHYPDKVLFGLGWFILPDSSAGKIVFHSGFKPGTNTLLLHNISKKQSVILLDNGNSPGIPVTGFNMMNLLNGRKTGPIKTAVTFLYAKDLQTKGVDYALIRMTQLLKDTLHYTVAPRDWIAMGYEFFRTGHIDESINTFRVGYMLNPDHDFLCLLYGDALAKAGKKIEASAAYNRALQINPKNEGAVKGLAAVQK
jgi:CubicO group peptidase (beta-lactamase class C family)